MELEKSSDCAGAIIQFKNRNPDLDSSTAASLALYKACIGNPSRNYWIDVDVALMLQTSDITKLQGKPIYIITASRMISKLVLKLQNRSGLLIWWWLNGGATCCNLDYSNNDVYIPTSTVRPWNRGNLFWSWHLSGELPNQITIQVNLLPCFWVRQKILDVAPAHGMVVAPFLIGVYW